MNILDKRQCFAHAMLHRDGYLPLVACHPAMEGVVAGEYQPGAGERGLFLNMVEAHGTPREGMRNSAYVTGVGSDDLTNTLGEAAKVPFIQRLQDQTADTVFCKDIEVKNFLPHEFPWTGVHVDILEATPELAEIKNSVSITDEALGVSAQVHSYGRNITISRKAIYNDQTSRFLAACANLGTAAGRMQSYQAIHLLESNPTLGDGGPMFHADYGNALAGAALSLTSIGSSTAALRRMQTASGIEADAKPYYLLVAAEYEALAKSIVHVNGLDLKVIATTRLAANGNWYVLAHQDQAPTIGILKLEKTKTGVSFGPGMPRDQEARIDGISLGIRFDFGVAALGRLGAVRRPYA